MAWTVVAHGSGVDFVIRVDPWNLPDGRSDSWTSTVAFVQRAVERNHSWTLRVRRFSDDPFGPVIHEERIDKRSQVPEAISRVERAIHSGALRSPD